MNGLLNVLMFFVLVERYGDWYVQIWGVLGYQDRFYYSDDYIFFIYLGVRGCCGQEGQFVLLLILSLFLVLSKFGIRGF